MQTMKWNYWKITYDAKANNNAYNSVDIGDPERCGCEYCLNYVQARANVYPEAFLELLNAVGVDYRKEAEVYHFATVSEGIELYGGVFHFIGSVELEDNFEGGVPEVVMDGENFKCSMINGRSLSHPAFEGKDLVEIEFTVKVPWLREILEEEN